MALEFHAYETGGPKGVGTESSLGAFAREGGNYRYIAVR